MFRLIYVVLMNLFRAPYLLPLMRKMAKGRDKYTEEERYHLCQKSIRWMMKSGQIETEVYGEEFLPKEGGYVMYPNHQGKYDALGIIYAHKEPCTFVMDKAKSHTFLVREIVNLIGARRLDIHNVRQGFKIMSDITEDVKKGKKYILFSEGGYFNNHNRVAQFKPGSFKCVIKAKAPIVPVALIDSYKPFNSSVMGKIITKVIFMPPMYYDEYKDMKTVELAEIVRNRIIDEMRKYGVTDND
ncbi:MAG: 1-acyl-sn-glycerol-3-phosphate acyltransferase [Lachnospiraceae bacterium]|nr:1-acyl-sn-glycerol-3-phosphate acyltransferase [Lachnospiraceae bacterium]